MDGLKFCVCNASPPILRLIFLEGCSTLRTGGVTCPIIFFTDMIALGTHIRHLKATEPTRDKEWKKAGPPYSSHSIFSLSIIQNRRPESKDFRVLRCPHSLELNQVLSREMNKCIDNALASSYSQLHGGLKPSSQSSYCQ